jgi:hypothetical protein
MNAYNENPQTISLYPMEIYKEDNSPDYGIEIDNACEEIYKACKGWGTSEKKLIDTIAPTTPTERKKISERYPELYDGKKLRDLMKYECGNRAFGEALQFLALGPVEAEVAMIKRACDGIGTDELLLYPILCGRSNADMELLKKTYYKVTSKDLVAKVTGEVSGVLKTVLVSAMQAAEEEYDPDFHTDDKAREDAEELHKAGQGRWGKDAKAIAKIVVLSPPKHLKNVNLAYADMYGYTLDKAIAKEFGGDSKASLLYTLGIKLKPYDTIAKLIKKACHGLGTNESLLTTTLIRYQDVLGHVAFAHEQLFEKSIRKRVKSEAGGHYGNTLLAFLNKSCPEE